APPPSRHDPRRRARRSRRRVRASRVEQLRHVQGSAAHRAASNGHLGQPARHRDDALGRADVGRRAGARVAHAGARADAGDDRAGHPHHAGRLPAHRRHARDPDRTDHRGRQDSGAAL
ncbi:MAG: hypothetical protein AVDCRST_MAG91-3706, partial [uncultured Sphingomonadaceae bacterium]